MFNGLVPGWCRWLAFAGGESLGVYYRGRALRGFFCKYQASRIGIDLDHSVSGQYDLLEIIQDHIRSMSLSGGFGSIALDLGIVVD